MHIVCAVAAGESCLRTNHISGNPPNLQDYKDTNLSSDIVYHQNQAIIPSYKFHCSGNITEWGVDVDRANSGDQRMYILDLQVWRPSPTVQTDGSYSLVGNNRFTSVLLSGGLARVTPLPQNRIQFQSGDVLGFYVESTRASNAGSRGVVTLNDFEAAGDGGFETEEVWYAKVANITLPDIESPIHIDVGPNRTLNTFTNAAPVISVSMSKYKFLCLILRHNYKFTHFLLHVDTADSCHSSPTVTIPIHQTLTMSNIQTLPAQSNVMPTRTSLVLYDLPTSTIEGTKSLPSVQPSSTNRVLMVTETLQPTTQSSRAPRNSKSFQSMLQIHRTASVITLESSWPTAPTARAPFITLDLQTIAIIAGAAAFVTTTCIVIAIFAVIDCKCNKSRQRHVKRVESMIGNAAYGNTVQNTVAIRTYRPGGTYDYPRFGLQLLKSVKGRGTEVDSGAAVRPDNTYTSVTTFSAQKNEAYVTSPTSGEDFEDNMQTNEAYVATPTSTRDFEHSMQINEAYVATPTSANGGLEDSMQQRDDEIYENYVANINELDEYSYVRYVYR